MEVETDFHWLGRGLTIYGNTHSTQPGRRTSSGQTFGPASWETLILTLSKALSLTILVVNASDGCHHP